MKILHILPPWYKLPPTHHGGVERVAFELINQNCLKFPNDKIYVFSTGDSIFSKKVNNHFVFEESIADKNYDRSAEIIQVLEALKLAERVQIDVIHLHSLERTLPLFNRKNFKVIWSVQCIPSLQINYILNLVENWDNIIPVFQTEKHYRLFNYPFPVHYILPNCIDTDIVSQTFVKGNYLSFIGTISKDKGIENAINISVKTGIPLVIGARINNENYFNKVIQPLLKKHFNLINYIGEVDDITKYQIMGKSNYLLFPIEWEEPFGIVIIESNLLGTPVLAHKRGSVEEIIQQGVNGFTFNNTNEIISFLKKNELSTIVSESSCIKTVKNNFSSDKVFDEYKKLYQLICN